MRFSFFNLLKIHFFIILACVSCECNSGEKEADSPTRLIGDRETKWATDAEIK